MILPTPSMPDEQTLRGWPYYYGGEWPPRTIFYNCDYCGGPNSFSEVILWGNGGNHRCEWCGQYRFYIVWR